MTNKSVATGEDVMLYCGSTDKRKCAKPPQKGVDTPWKGTFPTPKNMLPQTDMTVHSNAVSDVGEDVVFHCANAETAYRASKSFTSTAPIWMYSFGGAPTATTSTFYGQGANACNNFGASVSAKDPKNTYQAACHSFELPHVFSTFGLTPVTGDDDVTQMTKDWMTFAKGPSAFQTNAGHAPWSPSYAFGDAVALPSATGNGNVIQYGNQDPWYDFSNTKLETAANCRFWTEDVVQSWRAVQ